MSSATIGIDFGTTTSSMAWVDPRTGEAKVIKNAEGEEKTPSVVWFGADSVLVGTPAEQMLDDEDERQRVVRSVKRELVNAPTLALPGRRVNAVQVAAEVLKKLRRDAEDLHFQEPVTQAVVTCPAAFDALEREEIERAARLAGFAEVRLLAEPVAAALAYSRAGLGVGRHVLVYDLGGGTFDLALLREEAGGFELAMEPKGLRRCGGDDFDEALYDYFDEQAERQWGEPLNRQGRDLQFLRDCRKRKESLSAHDKVLFSCLVGEGRVFKQTLTRELFEGLIGGRIDTTVRLTGELVCAAEAQGFPVETVVLIGGSSRIPLVLRKLKEILPVEPRKWQHQDVAVALGAAYFGQGFWQAQPSDTQDFGTTAPKGHQEENCLPTDDVAAPISSSPEFPVLQETFSALEPQVVLIPQDIHGWSTEQVNALQRSVAQVLGLKLVFRVRLKDGTEGPEMVVIPPGAFLMGIPDSDDDAYLHEEEQPQHRVRIARPFAIGRCAVTFDEYDRFCTATARQKPDDRGWGRDRRPVINVSWHDAVAYCAWLSRQTGHTYRLPTEAEWEYAARAGTCTPYWWGDTISQGDANCGYGYDQFDNEQTVPVGSFQPNPFGLYDTVGNVCEWVKDVYHVTLLKDGYHHGYEGAPANGAAWGKPSDPGRRVSRGGSWNYAKSYTRVSARDPWEPNFRHGFIGLRLAQNLAFAHLLKPHAQEKKRSAPHPTVAPRSHSSAPPVSQEAVTVLDPQAAMIPQDIHGWSARKLIALQRSVAQVLGSKPVFRVRLKDGTEGPEMVVIPAGSFLMGAPDDDTRAGACEKPQHRVTIARPFAIGRYPVTQDEYERFCVGTGRGKLSTLRGRGGRHPATNIAWQDAVAYCVWLSQQTGQVYRLPTEAEWEYAARAGTTTCFWWGDDVHSIRGKASFEGNTTPVGSFKPNPFGLYDTVGNVTEWVQDSFHGDYVGAPSDGSEWLVADSERRGTGFFADLFDRRESRCWVLRGGSFCNGGYWAQSVSCRHIKNSPKGAPWDGMRLAQEISPGQQAKAW